MNCPHWLLALTIPFSRSDRAHTTTAGVGAGCPEGLFRTDRSAGKSPSVAGGPWGAFRREDYCNRCALYRQRTRPRRTVPGSCPGRCARSTVSPASRPLVDTPRRLRPPPPGRRIPDPTRATGSAACPLELGGHPTAPGHPSTGPTTWIPSRRPWGHHAAPTRLLVVANVGRPGHDPIEPGRRQNEPEYRTE